MFSSTISSTQKINLNNERKYTVVFDIDDCIAKGFDVESVDQLLLDYPLVAHFQKNNWYIDAVRPHILNPRIIQLIQLLDRMANIKIAFFSSGADERNILFVPKLMSLALGEDRYNQIKSHIKIGSRSNLLESTSNGKILDSAGNIVESMKDHRQYQNHWGQKKKDLSCVTDDIENTVIIDDDNSYSLPSQARNLLKVRSTCMSSFQYIYSSFKENKGYYDWKTDQSELNDDLASANNLYYATGLLFTALEHAENEQSTLVEALAKIQFIEDPDKKSGYGHAEQYHQLARSRLYYNKGLELFRQVNPTIDFIDDSKFFGATQEQMKPAVTNQTEQNIPTHNSVATNIGAPLSTSHPLLFFGNPELGTNTNQSSTQNRM